MKSFGIEAVVGISPYNPQNVDVAISHLERVLRSVDADSLFAHSYWRARILQVRATPGLLRSQEKRLSQLLQRFTPEATDGRARGQVANWVSV
jgi:hypothetical protein